ncbi:Hint domain-containing protein [Ruegeria halocynthiae]|uniref:Hint domain-containing protein n=1 Tax=Ruegeria halocynthiae TaxID=985054 RepID=UPI00055DDD6E|nr:Hint domain-containing protein [Ruegeria halocynthiae]
MVSITGDITGSVTGNPPNQATGDLDVASIGPTGPQNWTISSPPAFGTATINANGEWTYTVNPAFYDNLGFEQTATDTFTVQVSSTLFGTPFTLTQDITISIEGVCFTAGTLIGMQRGAQPIESLAVGDCVRTADNGLQPIRWIESSALPPERLRDNPAMRPVRIRAGSLGPDTPRRDLIVSQQHRILVRGPKVELLFGISEVLIAAKHLCSWPGISIEPPDEPVEYFHILLDNHEILTAEGAPAESLYLGEESLHTLSSDALQELAAIFPDSPTPEGAGFGHAARLILREFEARALT